MSSPTHFVLPDLLSLSTPFQDATNPHWRRVAAESRRWVTSYQVFTDRRRAFFFQGQSELLTSHCYPYADAEEYRTCCDFINLLFTIDEISDEQDHADALLTGNTFLHVLRDPSWTDGSKLAKMTAEVRSRFTRKAMPNTFRRVLESSQRYIDRVMQEVDLRGRGEILDLDGYLLLRRENSGVRLCFDFIPYCLGIDLPDDVVADATFLKAYYACVDMVCWANDLYSYNMELNQGHAASNFLTVLIQEKGMDIQRASDFVGEHYKRLMDDFLDASAHMPSFGPAVDRDVQRYLQACTHWPAGNLAWSFETPRYLGARRHEIKRTLIMPLKPLDREKLEED